MRLRSGEVSSSTGVGRLIRLGILGLLVPFGAFAQAAYAAAPQPIQLAERTLDLDAAADTPQTEIIEIEGVDNRFSELLLETLNGRFAIQTIRVTIDEGTERGIVRTLAVDKVITARDPTAEVRFTDTEARVRRVEVTFRRADSNATGKGLLRISARRLEVTKPAAPAEKSSPPPAVDVRAAPPSAADTARAKAFVKLAGQAFDLGKPEITIVLGEARALSALQFRTKQIPVIVRKVVVRLGSGETRDLSVAELIEQGGASRVIDLSGSGAGLDVREIVISLRQRTANEKGVIEVWGEPRATGATVRQPSAVAPRPTENERSAAVSPPSEPPSPPPAPPRIEPKSEPPRDLPPPDTARRDPRWKLLGAVREPERHGRTITRRARFVVRDEGWISAVRFIPRRDVIRLFDARVVFEDGDRQPLDVERYQLEPGQMTEVLGVRARGRRAVAVEVIFRPLGVFVGEPVLELWAQVAGTPGDHIRAGAPERARVVPTPGAPTDEDEE